MAVYGPNQTNRPFDAFNQVGVAQSPKWYGIQVWGVFLCEILRGAKLQKENCRVWSSIEPTAQPGGPKAQSYDRLTDVIIRLAWLRF